MCVFIITATKFNVESIQEFMSMMHKMNLKHSIIVYKDAVTPMAKKIIEENKGINPFFQLSQPYERIIILIFILIFIDMDIELFHVDDLQYNLTKHYLVPKHNLAYRKGRKGYINFKKSYDADKFPILLTSDPVAKFYHYQKGDIIRITRQNGFVSYRIVK